MRIKAIFLSAFFFQLPFEPASAKDEDIVVVQAGRIITVSGEEIEGGTIVIEGGLIKAVGKDIEVPWNARVFKYPKGTVMPGLIDCHTTLGLRVPNENVPNVPYISVLDGLDPSSTGLKNALRDGVTAVHVIPANATRIGGQGAIVRTAGRTVAEMVIEAPSGVKISLRPGPGETRMQTMAALRRTFFDLYSHVTDGLKDALPPAAVPGKPAAEPELASLIEEKPSWSTVAWDKLPLEKIGVELQPMVDLVRGKTQAFIYCATASDVFKAFEIADGNHLRFTLVLAPDAYKLVDVLKARKNLGPVILDSDLAVWETDPESGAEIRHVTPRIFFDAGIPFAVEPASDSNRDLGPRLSREGEYHLWYQAAMLVRHGIPRAEALKAVTLTPARILGLESRMGSLEKGKDANIAVFSADPLDARSWVELVFIEGKEVYRKEKDRDLQLLLREPERRF